MASHIVESTNGLPTFWPSLRSFQGIGLVQFESKYWDYFQTNSFHIGICSLALVLLYFYKVLSHNKRLCWIAYFTSAYSRPHVQDLKSSFVFISPTLNQAASLSSLTAKYPSCSFNGFVNEPCVNGWLNGDVKWSSWCLKWLTTKINRSSLVLVDCGENASMYFSQKVQWCGKRLYIMTSCAIHVYIYIYIYLDTLQWRHDRAGWRLRSPASRLFTQPFIHAQIKENIKALRHWPLCGEFTGGRGIPRHKGQ